MPRPKGLGTLVALWLLASVNGCSELIEQIKPDRVSVGISGRQIRGSYRGFKVDTTLPTYELGFKKKWREDGHDREDLDVGVRVRFNQGSLGAEHPVCYGKGEGNFENINLFIDYYPWETRAIGIEVGVEAFRSKFDMVGGLGPIKLVTPDRFGGGGGNLGLTGEIPLDKKGNCQFIWGVGRNFTATHQGRAHINMNGNYVTAGFQFNFGNK